MTSLLRRKRPTTRRSSRRTSNETRVSRRESRGASGWERVAPRNARDKFIESRASRLAPCTLFSGIAALVLIWNPVSASELRWRSERADAADRATQSQPIRIQTQSPAATKYTTTALRFVRPQTPSTRIDTSVRQTAFEDDAPQLTSGREPDTRQRSVIVNRDDGIDSVRSAQLPPTSAAAGAPSASGTRPQPGGQSPFNNDTPAELPQLSNPQLEQPPASNNTLPAPQPNAAAPDGTDPSLLAPRGGQFQPVLPSGPSGPEQTGLPTPETPTSTIEAEGVKAKESCEASIKNLRQYTVDKVKLTIGVTGTEGKDYPFECSIDDGSQFPGRCWDQTTYLWKASALCHKPLYFEDEQLERYGHSWSPCFQPFMSGAHFFCTLPVLPYCMGVEPPMECIYALGHYRPGSCAPYMCGPIPLSCRGALFEAGAVTGAAAILP
jgi:hypothetical protein